MLVKEHCKKIKTVLIELRVTIPLKKTISTHNYCIIIYYYNVLY